MKKTSLFWFAFALFAIIGYAFNPVEARESLSDSASSPEAAILDPGTVSSCQNDFVVENMDQSEAELKIVLGNEEFITERFKAREFKAYGIQGSLSQALLEGKRVSMSDWATIFNTDKSARVRLHCAE